MFYPVKRNPNRLFVYHEGRKRRVFVGELIYNVKKNRFEFTYDHHYRYAKNAIPLGPKLSLFQETHYSARGQLFPFFVDRIPDRENPAYPDYCASQGVSMDEKNPIILLGTIGRRGPSSFVFESAHETNFSPEHIVEFRKALGITQNDFAMAFDISLTTLQRFEANTSRDQTSMKLIEMFLNFPETALWQLEQTGGRLHCDAKRRLQNYFLSVMKKKKSNLGTGAN